MDIERIREILSREGDIAIALSANYSQDELAAALGLYLTLKNVGRTVQVISKKQPNVEISHFYSIDKIKGGFQGRTGDLVVSFPYQEGEIEKISYTMENGLLNIVVKSGEKGLNFSQNDVRFNRSGDTPVILITIGVRNLNELSYAFDVNLLNNSSVINIDNNQNNQRFGNVVSVIPEASTVSELVSDMIYSLGYNLDLDACQNMLWGMMTATNNFQNPKTSGLAFEMAGILMRAGAQRKQVSTSQVQVQNKGQFTPSQNQINQQGKQQGQKNPPPDWLAPKIYKGSTNVE